MDAFMDMAWFKILAVIEAVAQMIDRVLLPLHFMGPLPIIMLLALLAVLITKGIGRIYKTRRYRELEGEFNHWHDLRKEAMACADSEKGSRMARNIDNAKLNRVYYDYFFEGFMNNILTTILPILLVLSYVNEAFNAENLALKFGRDYVLRFSGSGGDPVLVGSVFCYVMSLAVFFLAWLLLPKRSAAKTDVKCQAPSAAIPSEG